MIILTKPMYQQNVKLCYMNTVNFIIHIKTKYVYKDIADDVEKTLDTSNYEVNKLMSTAKNKKAIGLMRSELVRKLMTEVVASRPKICSYLMGNGNSDKKS